MGSIKDLFRPSSKKFYILFDDVAENLLHMEQAFYPFLYENDLNLAKAALKTIEDLEHANDITTHKLIIELGKNFITPFDREDIHYLASTLDDIADYMYALVKQRIIYQIATVPRATQQVAERFRKVIKLLHEILDSLTTKDLLLLAVMSKEIKDLLHTSDKIIDNATADLLNGKPNPIETIKLVDHFKTVQLLLDKCGDAVHVIDAIIVKYS